MKIIKNFIIIFLLFNNSSLNADTVLFDSWLKNFKIARSAQFGLLNRKTETRAFSLYYLSVSNQNITEPQIRPTPSKSRA